MKQEVKLKQTEIGMIPEDWEVGKVGELFNVKNGKTNSQDAVENGKYPLFDRSTKIKRSNKFLFDAEAIIIPGEGKEFVPRYFSGKFDLHQRAYAITHKKGGTDLKFFFYVVSNNRNYLSRIAVGSTVRSLRINHLTNFPIPIPLFPEQKAIAKILSDLDSKIELLQKQNETLETIGKSIFKHWFVDFEFPNKEGKPYKSSGGKMVESEMGEIPEGWKVEKLGSIMTNYDSKRIPLSSMERKKKQGGYPYYGATKIMDYVDGFLFDGTYLLMAEDGSVTNEQGYPVLQYVNGQFWVSNHAHVIQGKLCSTEFIYLLLVKMNIEPYVTGAVQPKLNQANMNSIQLVFPSEETLNKGDKIIKAIFSRRLIIENEILSIQKTRDLLLPKLMSGKIRVPIEVRA